MQNENDEFYAHFNNMSNVSFKDYIDGEGIKYIDM